MPDYSDLFDGYYGNEDYLIWVFVVLFIFICVVEIFEFINNFKRKKKQTEVEKFYDTLAKSDMTTSFTCSSEE